MHKYLFFLATAVSGILYLKIGYYTEQFDHSNLLFSFLTLFIIYLLFLVWRPAINIRTVLYLAIGLRILLLFAIPNLSDDYYRFIWDGRLDNRGVNPFSVTPAEYVRSAKQVNDYDKLLFIKMNSPDYHSVYPPVLQAIFSISTRFTDTTNVSIIIMRLFIVATEIGTLFLILGLLKAFGFNESKLLMYALNPLVIIELTGNLHFEALMIFFSLLTIYLLSKSKSAIAFISLAFAVAVKLNPLIFFPLFARRLGLKKTFLFSSLSLILIVNR